MVTSRVYNTATEANVKASEHFKVKEFACKDGSKIVLIHDYLLDALEQLRKALNNSPITINSGYRTYTHNKAVGGASASYHLYGLAADIVVPGWTPLQVAQVADALFPDWAGIGLYNGYVHLDGRKVMKYRFDKRSGKEVAVTKFK